MIRPFRALIIGALVVSVPACGSRGLDSDSPERAVSVAAIASARSLLQGALGTVDSLILARTRVGFEDYVPALTGREAPQVPLDSTLVRTAIRLRQVDGSCVAPADCSASGSTGLVVLSDVKVTSANVGAVRLLMWARQSYVVYELEFERVGGTWLERRREQLLIS